MRVAGGMSQGGVKVKFKEGKDIFIEEDWKTATLKNGWTGDLRYRKNALGQVEIVANIRAGTVSGGTVIVILEEGYRPSVDFAFPHYDAHRGATYNSLIINTAGEVIIRALPANAILSDGQPRFIVIFPTD